MEIFCFVDLLLLCNCLTLEFEFPPDFFSLGGGGRGGIMIFTDQIYSLRFLML